jgi:D-alanyl-D-alanine carboxypeptidase
MRKLLLPLLFLFSLHSHAQESRRIADSIRIWRRVPALAYAVVSSDSIYDMGAVGYKKIRTKDTISLSNRFHTGSATVTFTSFIAAQLVSKGKLNWNTALFHVFPELKAMANKDFGNPTLADILSQHTGFPMLNNYMNLSTLPSYPGTVEEKRKKTVEWIVQQKRVGKDTIGSRRSTFTNANALVAAAMMEKVTGKSWESLLDEYLNKPLQISIKVGFPSRLDVSEPWGHWTEGGVFTPLGPTHWFGLNPSMAPAADANITLPDYVKFVQDELRGLRGKKAVLPATFYGVMHYSYPVYSIGWTNIPINEYHITETDGTIGTFYSHVEIIKEKNIAVIVMANSGDNSAKGAVLNLARALREMYVHL